MGCDGQIGKIVSQISPHDPPPLTRAGIPSRKLRSAGPRLPGPGGAPHWTYDLDRAGAVWLPPGRDGLPTLPRIPESPGSRAGSPGRRRRSCGWCATVHGGAADRFADARLA
ncbi:hypothetical protein KRM28CT15_45300 [Krasilnikovia sp. M28-CT-15]